MFGCLRRQWVASAIVFLSIGFSSVFGEGRQRADPFFSFVEVLLGSPTHPDFLKRQELMFRYNVVSGLEGRHAPGIAVLRPFLVPTSEVEAFQSESASETELKIIEKFKVRVDGQDFFLFPFHPYDKDFETQLEKRFRRSDREFLCYPLSGDRTFYCVIHGDEKLGGFYFKGSDPNDLVYHHADRSYVRGSIISNDLLHSTGINIHREFFGGAIRGKGLRRQGFIIRNAMPTNHRGRNWTQPLPLHVFLASTEFLEAIAAKVGITEIQWKKHLFETLGRFCGRLHLEFGFGVVPHFQNVWMTVNAKTGRFDLIYQDMGDVLVDPWFRFLNGHPDIFDGHSRVSSEVVSIAYESELAGAGDPISLTTLMAGDHIDQYESGYEKLSPNPYKKKIAYSFGHAFWKGYISTASDLPATLNMEKGARPKKRIDLIYHDYPGARWLITPGDHSIGFSGEHLGEVRFYKLSIMARQFVSEYFYPGLNRAQFKRSKVGIVERPTDEVIKKGKLVRFMNVTRKELLDPREYIWRREGELYFGWYNDLKNFPYPVVILSVDRNVDFRTSILKLVEACGRTRMNF